MCSLQGEGHKRVSHLSAGNNETPHILMCMGWANLYIVSIFAIEIPLWGMLPIVQMFEFPWRQH